MKPGDLLVLGFSCQLNSVVGRLGGSKELMVNLIGLVCKCRGRISKVLMVNPIGLVCKSVADELRKVLMVNPIGLVCKSVAEGLRKVSVSALI